MSKPPEPKLSSTQEFQKGLRRFFTAVGDLASAASQAAVEKLQEVDKAHGITSTAAEMGKRVGEAITTADRQVGVSDMAASGGKSVAEFFDEAAARAQGAAERSGLGDTLRRNVLDPAQKAADAIADTAILREGLDLARQTYGKTRGLVREVFVPDLPTYDAHELLRSTRQELNYVAACILQISPEDSTVLGRQFGRAVTAKVSGAAGAGALLAMVATFGNAGTGAAIAGLSGAAATNATLAWVGSLVGGGMAVGAVLSGGFAVLVGYGAVKSLESERREVTSLSALELQLVQSCWMLGSLADAYSKHPERFGAKEAERLEQSLKPVYQQLTANIDLLCEPLDGKHRMAMRHHALPDFKGTVLDRWTIYLDWARSPEGQAWCSQQAAEVAALPKELPETSGTSRARADPEVDEQILMQGHAQAAIGGVFAALLTREPLDDSIETTLVLGAIRRSTTQLADATEGAIGDYLRSLSTEQLRGVASNVKGIYHELWYVQQYNDTHEQSVARMFGTTNHAGADVQICDADTGHVIREVQLKAVATSAEVKEHLARYPHIDVAATDEVATSMHSDTVRNSGVSNEALQTHIHTRLDALHDHTIANRTGDVGLAALGVASMAELLQMLRGERAFPQAVVNAVSTAGTAAAATSLTALLFS
ncbi:hypothetical protein [Variovorax guangxiensis]|uniref:hypothetical protein n=1 Tax=Variovorax guangxiensis TaxID=1775474 RepID=UPI002854937B|nr:hypothetical protein [Variovorax guangxiensis]MDR6857855.1 hypothetical protein [Variovorax guangxiensis]